MRKTMLAFLLTGFVATPALADSDFGVKAGMLSFEDDESAATQVGIVYSMDLLGMVGAEFDLTTTAAKGEIISGVEYSTNTLGAFAVVMTPGPFYVKGKAGLMYVDGDFDLIGSENDSNPAYGVGIGFTFFELEYTRTQFEEADVDFISLNFKF
ncbi:MAG TPA: hypothetical protein VNL72_00505 [Gammaproteobacteria bacterium]|nr:hypothetical protein [Gammaproteobacteria bacterium]